MRDRYTPSLAFLIALALHVFFLLLISRQYLASANNPRSLNQTAQRLTTINGRPVRFIYVKDMIPAKEPPMDASRLSDMNRRGASPYPKKGESPDPTSFGQSPTRQSGGPGGAPDNRPSVPPSPASPSPRPGRPGSAGREMAQMERPRSPRGESRQDRQADNQASKPSPTKGQGEIRQGKPTNAERGLPVGGESVQEPASSLPGSPSQTPIQPRPGLGTQLERMMLGSLQGGYNNPNASRLNTGSLSFDTAAWDLGPYARQVQERVQGNWHVPEAQMVLRQKGWVAIRFNVQKDGTITDMQIVRPSGIPSYDQAAVDALRSSNPLPPLPSQVTAPKLGAVFRFFYNLQDEGD